MNVVEGSDAGAGAGVGVGVGTAAGVPEGVAVAVPSRLEKSSPPKGADADDDDGGGDDSMVVGDPSKLEKSSCWMLLESELLPVLLALFPVGFWAEEAGALSSFCSSRAISLSDRGRVAPLMLSAPAA